MFYSQKLSIAKQTLTKSPSNFRAGGFSIEHYQHYSRNKIITGMLTGYIVTALRKLNRALLHNYYLMILELEIA